MELRPIVPGYAVAPQITADDLTTVAADGFRVVICNRPDEEVPNDLAMAVLAETARALGLSFVENPVAGGGLTEAAVDRQADAIRFAEGPVLAYCASGTRSAILWALTEASSRPVADILSATAAAGYQLDGLAPQIEALARR